MSETASFTGEGFDVPPFDMGVYQELERSRDYIDAERYPDHYLYKKLIYWREQLSEPFRSERSRRDVGRLVLRLALEITEREKEQIAREDGSA